MECVISSFASAGQGGLGSPGYGHLFAAEGVERDLVHLVPLIGIEQVAAVSRYLSPDLAWMTNAVPAEDSFLLMKKVGR